MADEMIEKTKNATIDYDSSKVEKTKVVSVSSVIALAFTVTLKDNGITHILGVILRAGVEAGRVTIDPNNGFYNVSFETPVLGVWLIELCKVERATDAEGRAPRHSARMEPVQEIFLALLRVSHFPGFFHHRKTSPENVRKP